ncbi:cytochrome ubiquinol oxidase subunit I [Hydrogenophaga sp. YM1]|uniref:cytochrome ubiquinol oxidase subunit I n=1 Tax=Hydrogenophaga TaxID=47420 RepID=UPI00086F2629|nr:MULTISPECIES: cytochrome ubiquinol oxidase subunit I [unclassified Hydrogenophaga]MBN9370518.1 cytochrome ubiquinol oxidase subunit I [Hydrogenophaga sp.]ODT29600.1 MAG: cytochrome D ubiquinol oxidase subunit I [Hydrogenophaga sp. SCN 70-13]OJV69991.1 MAG: cytochrome ubiquinol oxidase subunit I [Hydrogenophaga sp. 70-12]QRR35401.1 cytochrome ubiquinol oxidase subunit I [Hydrogenophaga sp. YM1]
MEFDTLLLSRLQFAANISFHILFPTITIALGWFLLFFRLRFVRTREQAWEEAYYFWTKVFALSFALGVVSGVTMSFQFGTNWPGFMEKAGNIAGPLLGYEVLTAFFLEASFLGIMLFGRGRVSERVHLIATFLVALGTTFSAFWILSLNSWMQTPAGAEIVKGEFIAVDWFAIVFNPSFPYRLAHKLLASGLTASFLIAGLCAWQLLKGSATGGTHKALRTAVFAAALIAPVQIFVGDLHGLNTLKHQPAKVAAIEAVWETEKGAALTLFGIPDEKAGTTHYAVKVPKLGSLILTHEWEGELRGIADFPNAHPPVAPVFYAFRVMVGVGSLMLLVALWGVYKLWPQRGDARTRLPRPLLWTLAAMTFSGWLATLAGWYVTEIGRQPFIVYGLLRTADVATTIASGHVALTLAAYLTVYGLLLITYVGVLKYMAEHPVKHAPEAPHGELGKAGA